MASYTNKVTIYLDSATLAGVQALATSDQIAASAFVRRLIERHVAGDFITVERFAKRLEFLSLGVDALLQAQPWKKELHQIVRDAHRKSLAERSDAK